MRFSSCVISSCLIIEGNNKNINENIEFLYNELDPRSQAAIFDSGRARRRWFVWKGFLLHFFWVLRNMELSLSVDFSSSLKSKLLSRDVITKGNNVKWKGDRLCNMSYPAHKTFVSNITCNFFYLPQMISACKAISVKNDPPFRANNQH